MTSADVVALVLVLAIAAYACGGGADYGAGFWDLTAGGDDARRPAAGAGRLRDGAGLGGQQRLAGLRAHPDLDRVPAGVRVGRLDRLARRDPRRARARAARRRVRAAQADAAARPAAAGTARCSGSPRSSRRSSSPRRSAASPPVGSRSATAPATRSPRGSTRPRCCSACSPSPRPPSSPRCSSSPTPAGSARPTSRPTSGAVRSWPPARWSWWPRSAWSCSASTPGTSSTGCSPGGAWSSSCSRSSRPPATVWLVRRGNHLGTRLAAIAARGVDGAGLGHGAAAVRCCRPR